MGNDVMKNALLVDDDPITNLINKKALERTGLFTGIDTVLNGMQALNFLKELEQNSEPLPDVILLDLNMPVMGGFSFLEEFEKQGFAGNKKIKIIILSSSDNSEDIVRARGMGVSDYLTKPISEKRLVNALE